LYVLAKLIYVSQVNAISESPAYTVSFVSNM
jgi:hypothetical protein